MKINISIFVLLLAIVVQPVLGDKWSFPPEKVNQEYIFDKTKIILTRDSTENQTFPDFVLSIYFENNLMAQYRNVGFEEIVASDDNKIFVGLSNSGIPGTAYVVFDYKGRLLRETKHQYSNFEYCKKSITIVRDWYNKENPDVKFKFYGDKKYLNDIVVSGCNGTTLSLIN